MLNRLKSKIFWTDVFGNLCLICSILFCIGFIAAAFIGLVYLLSYIGIHGIITAIGFFILLVILAIIITLWKR